jgi:hypothetical protein
MLANRQDVRRYLPDILVAHHAAPRRHAQAALLPAIGDRLNDAFGVKLASREIDATLSVRAMAMGTLLCQEELVAAAIAFGSFRSGASSSEWAAPPTRIPAAAVIANTNPRITLTTSQNR